MVKDPPRRHVLRVFLAVAGTLSVLIFILLTRGPTAAGRTDPRSANGLTPAQRQLAVQNAAANAAFIREATARLNDGGHEIRVRARSLLHGGTVRHTLQRSRDLQCVINTTVPVAKATMVTLEMPEGDRHFVVYVPKSYIDKRSRMSGNDDDLRDPVLFLYHGLGDNCESFLSNTGFIPHAERDGHVIVSGCGTPGWLGTAWNAGMCCGFSGDAPDELAYSVQVLETLRLPTEPEAGGDGARGLGLCASQDATAAVGFSNGAMLAEVLGCRAPNVFRVVGSVGGVTEPRPGGAEGLAVCDEAVASFDSHHRPSVIMVHGDADWKVPWGGNSFIGFPSVPQNVDGWLARNHCNANTSRSTINNPYFVNTIYGPCSEPGERVDTTNVHVEIVRVVGGGHLWPERDGFSTTDHVYEFVTDKMPL